MPSKSLPLPSIPLPPPAVTRRRARARPAHLKNLVDLAVALKHGLAARHLGKDAARRPHVDGCRVRRLPEEDLGRAVPERDDLVRVGAQRHSVGAREAEIGKLEHARRLVDEDVLRLEIAVHDAVRVARLRAREQLVQEPLGPLRGHARAEAPHAVERRLEVALHELEDEVQVPVEGHKHVAQRNNVRVLHLLEHGDLAQRRRGDALVPHVHRQLVGKGHKREGGAGRGAERGEHELAPPRARVARASTHLLHRDDLVAQAVLRLINDTVRALAERLLEFLVPVACGSRGAEVGVKAELARGAHGTTRSRAWRDERAAWRGAARARRGARGARARSHRCDPAGGGAASA